MCTCCGINSKSFGEKFDFNISNIADGITIDVKPKDKSKVEAFQKFAEAYRDFFGSDCC